MSSAASTRGAADPAINAAAAAADNRDSTRVMQASSRLARKLDAAVARASFRRLVGVARPRLAVAGGRQPASIDGKARHQCGLDRGGTPLRQIEVEGIAGDAVGVAGDVQLPVGMAAQQIAE